MTILRQRQLSLLWTAKWTLSGLTIFRLWYVEKALIKSPIDSISWMGARVAASKLSPRPVWSPPDRLGEPGRDPDRSGREFRDGDFETAHFYSAFSTYQGFFFFCIVLRLHPPFWHLPSTTTKQSVGVRSAFRKWARNPLNPKPETRNPEVVLGVGASSSSSP